MSSVNAVVDVTPKNTDNQIVPSSNPTLVAPYDESAVCITETDIPELIFNCTVQIPKEVDWSNVQVLQYYNASNAAVIEIYFVYDVSGESGIFNTYTVSVKANNKDANEESIDFTSISTIVSLMQGIGPKTSRGTRTLVRHTGEA
jgi:hypothetical protein